MSALKFSNIRRVFHTRPSFLSVYSVSLPDGRKW